MFSTQDELLSWMSTDNRNIERFLSSLEKIMRGKMVLIMNETEERAITAFWLYKKNLRVRR